MNQLIKELISSGKLWRRPCDIPETDYQDILQISWIYFDSNLCDGKTAPKYDGERSSVPTWINAYIRMRILDYYLRRKPSPSIDDPEVRIPPSPPEPPNIIEDVMAWLKRDSAKLRRVHLKDRPDINCYSLILSRLPTEDISWTQLAQNFMVTKETLQGFYRRECLPRLREAGKQLGYL
jgi:hypothetical protein